jgi:hypothetical protein
LSGKPLHGHTFHVSKFINAPLPFVYRWCTDFREDDNKITGSKSQRRMLQKTRNRVVYLSIYRSHGKTNFGVNIVLLKPPRAWHLDFVGEEEFESGDYRLTELGARKTRLDMTFNEQYKIRNHPSQAEDTKHTNEIWDKYIAALERDYRHTG